MLCHDLLSLVWLQDISRTRGLSFLSHGEAWGKQVDESVFGGKYKAQIQWFKDINGKIEEEF